MVTKAPTNYIEAEVEIANMMKAYSMAVSQMENGIRQLKLARDAMDHMSLPAPQGYGSLGDFLRTKAVAHPADPVWGALGPRMERTSMEFNAKRDELIGLLRRMEGGTLV